MKRVAIIITDADRIAYQGLHFTGFGEHTTPWCEVEPSGQLLEDLWNLVDGCEALDIPHLRNAAARVRDLLPEEGPSA